MSTYNLRPEMTLAEFSAIKDDLLKAAQARIASTYFKDKADYDHRIRNFNYAIEGDGITFEYTYNDACGCHPEYTTDTTHYTFEQINDWCVVAM